MNVATVKTGKRGRPRFRRFRGTLFEDDDGLLKFVPSEPDLFGFHSVPLLLGPDFFPVRSASYVASRFAHRESIDVVLAFDGNSVEGRYSCKFVGFCIGPGGCIVSRRI